MQQVSNSTRIFAINAAARSRLSAVYIFSIFIGQLIGTSIGARIYLKGGYRASGGFCLGLLGFMLAVLLCRGPHCPTKKWLGYEGGWSLQKIPPSKITDAEKVDNVQRKEDHSVLSE